MRPQPTNGRTPDLVAGLYESSFVDGYDIKADLWERLVCQGALAAFDSRLQRLPPRPLRVLDLGCGTGRNLHRLHRAGIDIDTYVGVDSSRRMLAKARRNHPYTRARFIHGDAQTALREHTQYDLVLATWLLSHYPDAADLIDQAQQALSPSGRLLVIDLTHSRHPLSRVHAWRYRRFLHATPLEPTILNDAAPSFLAATFAGLITVAEIPAADPAMVTSPSSPPPPSLPNDGSGSGHF